MLELSAKTNLLEENDYRYSLQDVKDPVLYRDVYNYDEVPKVAFNHRRVPMSMPADIWITDTSFRDGQQSMNPYTPEQIEHLFKLLSKLGGPYGLIRQTEFFIYSKRDREAIERCQALGLRFPEITTWIRATREDFRLVKDLGIKETGILVSCSDYHIFKKMQMTRRQALDYYLATVKDAFEAGVMPRCHLEDITRADFYGFVVPFVNELMELSQRGRDPRPHPGLRYHGLRRSLHRGGPAPQCSRYHLRPAALFRRGKRISGMARPQRLLQGCRPTPPPHGCTAPAASTAPCWASASAPATCRWRRWSLSMPPSGVLWTAWTPPPSRRSPTTFEHEIGYHIPPMTPFVGRNFNVTRAGIHADGLLKDEEIYNIFNTEKLLDRPAAVAVSKTSGLAGIAYWINQNYRLRGEHQLSKHDALVEKLKDWVDEQYAGGRTTALSNEELEEKIAELSGGVLKPRH